MEPAHSERPAPRRPAWCRRRAAVAAGFAALALVGYGGWYVWQLLRVGAAYEAKALCSAVFVSGRDPDAVLREDLDLLPRLLTPELDRGRGAVTVRVAGLRVATASYRQGLGCTLLSGVAEADLRAQARSVRLPPPHSETSPPLQGPGRGRLASVVEAAFSEPDPERPRRTRAVLVLRGGEVLAERYAEGIGPGTPLGGWSMGKCVVNALVGILVRQGRLSLHSPAPVPEWAGDVRSRITLDQLLRMTSGLAFDERPGAVLSDVNRMLFLLPDAAAYAAGKPLLHPPGKAWAYASGTTNILSRVIQRAVGGSLADYWAFPRRELFDPLGMRSAVLEPDAAGDFVGSSFAYATARDWGRLGQLFLGDGVWNGRRILPEGWVAYTTTPTPLSPGGSYGAHFWLYPGPLPGEVPKAGGRPAAFYASGYESQCVVVVPSRDLVVVRLGNTPQRSKWDAEAFVRDVLAAVGE